MSFKGSQVAFVLQEKSKLSRISEVEWHWVSGRVDKTFIGKGELSKNTQKDQCCFRINLWELQAQKRETRELGSQSLQPKPVDTVRSFTIL